MCILYLSFITTKIRYFLWNENKNERYAIIGKTKSTIFLFQKYKNNLVPKHLVYGV